MFLYVYLFIDTLKINFKINIEKQILKIKMIDELGDRKFK